MTCTHHGEHAGSYCVLCAGVAAARADREPRRRFVSRRRDGTLCFAANAPGFGVDRAGPPSTAATPPPRPFLADPIDPEAIDWGGWS